MRSRCTSDGSRSRTFAARSAGISLLKHEQPGVYVSENLPRMDELSDVPIRPREARRALARPARGGEELPGAGGRVHRVAYPAARSATTLSNVALPTAGAAGKRWFLVHPVQSRELAEGSAVCVAHFADGRRYLYGSRLEGWGVAVWATS